MDQLGCMIAAAIDRDGSAANGGYFQEIAASHLVNAPAPESA
jgi:hypothetical protein